jgi:hypothetical protein
MEIRRWIRVRISVLSTTKSNRAQKQPCSRPGADGAKILSNEDETYTNRTHPALRSYSQV